MDIEQINSRLEWLDEERRNDKASIAALHEKVAKLEGMLDKTNEEMKSLGSEVTEAKTFVARIEKFDSALDTHRKQVKKLIDSENEKLKKRESTTKKKYGIEINENRSQLQKLDKRVADNAKMKMELKARTEGQSRLDRLVSEQKDEVKKAVDEMQDSVRLATNIQTEQRQESRRLNDAQGEITSLRKRVDEHKAKLQLVSGDQQKVEVRLSDVIGQFNEREEAHTSFIDRVTTTQADQERAFKEWKDTLENLDTQSEEIRKLISNIQKSDRDLALAKEEFENITEQLKRRINEITEMQRLGEERFRQEWATFKADDQKRWTNYTLTQDELQRESTRQLGRLSDQTNDLSESLQEARDILQHVTEQNDKMLQTTLGNMREWLNENEKFTKSVS